jgi:tetratricopeptide (TPR) repeat protein
MNTTKPPLNALITTAQRAEQEGDLEAAASAWREVRFSYPDSPVGFAKEGSVLKRHGQLSDAVSVLGQGLERFPKDEWIAVEHAWALNDLGDYSKAVDRWREIRTLFPESPAGYVGGGLTSRRAAAFDEADDIYRAALTRFPDNLDLCTDFAWSAEERRDLVEALHRWSTVQERFPNVERGYVRSGIALLHLNRLDEADAVLAEAVRRFPDSEDALTSHAWVAHNRRDWPEALKRWELVIKSFPQLRDPRRLAAQGLMELGRYEEAAAVLAPALRMFPEDQNIAVLNGWLATRRRDIAAAEAIWCSVRERFPENLDGYWGWALALREVGRLDDAEAVLVEASQRFPENSFIALDLAQIPERKHNWPLATSRWTGVISRFPELVGAYIGLGRSLLYQGDLAAADAVYKRGRDRFPDNAEMAAAEAQLAAREGDWPRVLQIWTTVQNRFPDNTLGYLGLGRALRECGQLDRAVETLSVALQRFPNIPELEVQLALTLSAKRDWPVALALWESLKSRFPGHSEVRSGITLILDKALSDQAAARDAPFEIPPAVLATDADASDYIKALGALFKRFESLGDTCEFAMVQRMFQVDQVSLLRWAATSPENLVKALSNRFEGVGDPEHTIVAISGDEFTTEDRRYLMHSHTFTSPAAEPLEVFAPEQCRRLQWLRRRLIDNLTAASKIFVYKYEDGLSDSDVSNIYTALCCYCPEIALLCVKLEESGHPCGTIQLVRGGLFVGYIDRFSTVDISVSAWIRLCQSVAEKLPVGANRAKVA